MTREWYLVGKVVRGERALTLPHGGTQLFHRVALDRVGRAVANALEHAPDGTWACNVGDPSDLTFGGLAHLVATEFGHEWELGESDWADDPHPWNVRHPVVADTRRLTDVLASARARPARGHARAAALAARTWAAPDPSVGSAGPWPRRRG